MNESNAGMGLNVVVGVVVDIWLVVVRNVVDMMGVVVVVAVVVGLMV